MPSRQKSGVGATITARWAVAGRNVALHPPGDVGEVRAGLAKPCPGHVVFSALARRVGILRGKQVVELRVRRAVKKGWMLAGVGVICLLAPVQTMAERSTVSNTVSVNGAPGLLDMPTAEVAPDGTLSFTYSKFGPFSRGTLSFQITPRLSGSFRYSGVDGLYAAPGDDDVYHDRNFDLRFRLVDEGALGGWTPAVSIGLNDFLGTGLYASEYVVATKSVGSKLRLTGGVGWGRMGSLSSFGATGTRPAIDFGLGGKPNYDQWFRGDMALFGGVAYQINDRLTLKAEYSSDAYVLEESQGVFTRNSPFNFGLDYAVAPGMNLSAYYMYGDTIGAQFSVAMNPRNPTARSGLEEAPLSVRPRPARSVDAEAWGTEWVDDPDVHPGIQTALATALAKEGQVLQAMSMTATRAELRIENNRFNSPAQAIGRTARVMTRAFPASVETFVITTVANGVPISSVVVSRSDIEALEHAPAPDIHARAQIADAFAVDSGDMVLTPGLYPRFSWSLAPYTVVGLFGANTAVGGELGARLSASYEIMPGLVLAGALKKRVIGNLHNDPWISDSLLPHVRSDVAQYHAQGDPAVETLTLSWYARPGRNLYSRVTVGYLETMYAGISGEVLWKPVDSRLALGAELNWVRQRDFDQMFGLQDYSIATGHVSAYYDLGNGFQTQLDVGRYLASDYGATLAVDRVFANGWSVGAYATLTDVSDAEFGEGSFDKGIRMSIPLEWALGTPSRSKTDTDIRSLARDGGARLAVDGRLFEWVQEGHGDVLTDRWGRFWR